MLRSMYSGISGMKVNQTRLDVIGNNIGNVNTTGFKSSRARFSETLSQNVSEASAPTVNSGGVNGGQVGLGVQLAAIDRIMTQGNMQSTSRTLDVAIDGNGYFMVSASGSSYSDNGITVNTASGTHNVTSTGTSMMYTRDGAFYVDSAGNLCSGNGYKVLGYSVTNDDNAQEATSLSPGTVSAGGFDFNFGAGSQLNGYTIKLGKIAAETATKCTIDKENKEIIINGDFSTTSNLTAEKVQEALQSELDNKGISQSVVVSGKVATIANTTAQKIAGGTSAAKPDKFTFAGFNIQFDEGAELNGYKFEIKNVSQSKTEAEIDKDNHRIILSGNFVENEGVTAEGLATAINKALKEKNISQKVASITGSGNAFTSLRAEAGTATQAVAPEMKDNTVAGQYSVDFTADSLGAAVNGYKIKFSEESSATTITAKVSGSTITVTGSHDLFTKATTTGTDIADAINKALDDKGIEGIKVEVTRDTSKTYDLEDIAQVDSTKGVSEAAIKKLPLGYNNSFTITFPKPSELVKAGKDKDFLDNVKFVISDVDREDLNVEFDPTKKIVTIAGNFREAGQVESEELADKINDKLGLTGDAAISISGSSKVYSGLKSDDAIANGSVDAAPTGKYEVLGFTFEPLKGSTLNGYTIQAGTVSAGTRTSVDVNTDTKTITINGDFVNQTITKDGLSSVLSSALSKAGLGDQGIKVDGGPVKVAENIAASEELTGGTPKQSLDENGNVNFVSARSDVNAYDKTLKTLKIPESVNKNGKECKVKSYSISADGIITAALDDGSSAALGQIAMADFANTEGLTSIGGNMYQESANSGIATIRTGSNTTGEDNSKGFGKQMQGYLEMSNVDLSEQFTEMITATRAFQASSKMISTGDDILQEIINLKR